MRFAELGPTTERLPLNVVRRIAGHRELSTIQTYLSLRSENAFDVVNLLSLLLGELLHAFQQLHGKLLFLL